jgi:hypothetical protein
MVDCEGSGELLQAYNRLGRKKDSVEQHGETNVPEPAAALPGTVCIHALHPSSRARVSALVCKKRKTKNMVPKREVVEGEWERMEVFRQPCVHGCGVHFGRLVVLCIVAIRLPFWERQHHEEDL